MPALRPDAVVAGGRVGRCPRGPAAGGARQVPLHQRAGAARHLPHRRRRLRPVVGCLARKRSLARASSAGRLVRGMPGAWRPFRAPHLT